MADLIPLRGRISIIPLSWDSTGVVLLASSRIMPDYATNGVGQVAVSTFSSPTPITIYNPSNPTMVFANAFTGYGKITSTKSVTGLTTTNIYNANGFLAQTIDLEIAHTNSFGYTTDGLMGTFTNELGLNVSATWDNLLRLTSVQFPDSTYISNIYNRLDRCNQRPAWELDYVRL